jgi:hypothetical protein
MTRSVDANDAVIDAYQNWIAENYSARNPVGNMAELVSLSAHSLVS